MSETIDFAKAKAERSPHLACKARCVACKHEWQAVAPLGTLELECPSCGLTRGQWMYPFNLDKGQMIFVCNTCDVTGSRSWSHRAFCVGCGQSHYPWAEDMKP